MSALMREPLFIPESMGVIELLARMRSQRVHLAIVVDEFGGTEGLVTIEDVVEETVEAIAHQHGIFALERECQAPVAADIYRPMPSKLAVQGVQPPARRVHVLRGPGIVQRKKLLPEPLGMVRLDFCLGACPEELLDTLVPEALYHPYSVYYRYTCRQRSLFMLVMGSRLSGSTTLSFGERTKR